MQVNQKMCTAAYYKQTSWAEPTKKRKRTTILQCWRKTGQQGALSLLANSKARWEMIAEITMKWKPIVQ